MTEKLIRRVTSLNPLKAFSAVTRSGGDAILSRIPPESLKLPADWKYDAENSSICYPGGAIELITN